MRKIIERTRGYNQMKQGIFRIIENRPIAERTYILKLEGDTSECGRSGSFVNIKIEGFYLRRPISVCDLEGDCLTLIYKTVGEGTAALAALPAGGELDLLSGLGNGYDTSVKSSRPLLIGGGVGVPPLYLLCRTLREAGLPVKVILGFNSAGEVFFEEEFKALGAEVRVTTTDGSRGLRGFVTDALPGLDYDYFFTCGPLPMLRAVYDASREIPGQFSFEERMGCGFGGCMGCTCQTKSGAKRVCREGPVFPKEEIIW